MASQSDVPDGGRKEKEGKSTAVSDRTGMWKHWNARKDLQVIIHTGNIRSGKWSPRHFENETLRETVRYILQSNNIQLLSWGTRRLFVEGEQSQFPFLVRKASVDVMWRIYAKDRCSYPTGIKKVRRTLFCDIVSKITHGDTKQRACID